MLTASPKPQSAPAATPASQTGQSPISSGDTCSGGLSSGKLRTIYNIRPRRIAVVDEERGTTWGVYNFNHRGVLTVQMRDGSTRPSYAPTPQTMVIAEVFKLAKKGKIRDTIAVGTRAPYAAGDGWAGGLFSQSR